MHLKRNIKELIRHGITRSGLNGPYMALRSARGQKVDHLRERTLTQRFSTIYRNHVRLNDRLKGSLSGVGSELETTESVRVHLPTVLAFLKTKILLDVGCGDFNWMREVALNCHYIGVDCVQDVIDQNTASYGSANRVFSCLDATTDPLPQADTVLCHEILFYLSFEDIWAIVRNVCVCGATTLIATTDAATEFNADIRSGDYRLLNLNESPFYFPPTLFIADDAVQPGRTLGVWEVCRLE